MMKKELILRTSHSAHETDVTTIIEMIAQGKLQGYEDMVTSRVYIEDVVEKGLLELINNKDNHIKILVTPKRNLMC